jgi:glycine/D-amino acid oxidase-like deaminating enzyme
MAPQPSFIVIGAGIVGASIAFRLATGGAKVTVIDAEEPGSGTSSTSFAWVNAHDKAPREYHDLNVAGMKAHKELASELGTDWYHETGCLEWRTPSERARHVNNVKRLQTWDYEAKWIEPDEAIRMVPAIARDAFRDSPVAYFPEEGWVETAAYIDGLIRRVSDLGSTVLTQTKVVSINQVGNRVVGVTTASGVSYQADTVINCTGRWADDPLFQQELRIPMAPSLGLMVFVDTPDIQLDRVLFTPRCHIRPDGHDRLLICNNDAISTLAAGVPISPDMPEADALIRNASEVLPALGSRKAVEVRLGVRAIPADGLPAIGPIANITGYYVAVMHSGVTLAPVVGSLVADELLSGVERFELTRFRPQRLLAPTSHPLSH